MPLQISQVEYVTYVHYIKDVHDMEKCSRKLQLNKMGLVNDRFIKLDSETQCTSDNFFDEFKKRITFINDIHSKLEKGGELNSRKADDSAPLVADYYLSHQKVIQAWNEIFKKDLCISLPSIKHADISFSDKTMEQVADEKALNRYFELLKLYPKLKREGDLNDHTKGTYQILYDLNEIKDARAEIYQSLYKNALAESKSSTEAHEIAILYSRPGVVYEDRFWIWVKDIVISPQKVKHTYNRIIQKSDLSKIGGAAALPIINDGTIQKITLVLIFRHATNSWHLEMPRGNSKTNESNPETTAKREVKEETGYESDDIQFLGFMTPDTGLTASIIPVYAGEVTIEGETKYDKTEAIRGKYTFTFKEIMEGLNRGFIEVEINKQKTQVSLQDPFLAYALLMAQHRGIIKN